MPTIEEINDNDIIVATIVSAGRYVSLRRLVKS